MTQPLVLGLPSKGRLQDQCVAWLADADLTIVRTDGERGYAAVLQGFDDIEVRLLAAREIALGLEAGDLHVGVTGEDLLQEESASPQERLEILRRLGFGRADVVVAAPQSWLDVVDMDDLEEVAAQERARRGRQMRVATKYPKLTRRFFAHHGLADYRIVASHGATEGAPANGAADIIVDITTSGATLNANHLKPLSDGVILRSEAVFAASLAAPWTPEVLAALARVTAVLDARAEARNRVIVRLVDGAAAPDADAVAAAARLWEAVSVDGGRAWVCPRAHGAAFAAALRDVAGREVVISPLSYAFRLGEGAVAGLRARLQAREQR